MYGSSQLVDLHVSACNLTLTADMVQKYENASDTQSEDASHLASGKQTVTSSMAPSKRAAIFNIQSSCGGQAVENLAVKIAQVFFLESVFSN